MVLTLPPFAKQSYLFSKYVLLYFYTWMGLTMNLLEYGDNYEINNQYQGRIHINMF
jgi:hypothetical protein